MNGIMMKAACLLIPVSELIFVAQYVVEVNKCDYIKPE
jgi:hypothetical protein